MGERGDWPSTAQTEVQERPAPEGYKSWLAYWQSMDWLLKSEETVPPPEDCPSWREHWKAQGTPWRKEPEIDEERQRHLAERRAIEPDFEKGIYPFKDVILDRADVEWLLATHESEGEMGPVAWPPPSDALDEDPFRLGLDLRGAVLVAIDLSELPLTRVRAGLEDSLFPDATLEQRDAAAIVLEGANLWKCQLQEAELIAGRLQGAFLLDADIESAFLAEATLDEADLSGANIASAEFVRASLKEARLNGAKATSAHFHKANLEQADFRHAILHKAHLGRVRAEYANFTEAELQHADLEMAELGGAFLASTHLEGAKLNNASLAGAVLSEVFFDGMTKLNDVTLSDSAHGTAQLLDIHWGDVNLAVIDWTKVSPDVGQPLLKALRLVKGSVTVRSVMKTNGVEVRLFDARIRQAALRANRQLAVVLRAQGLNQDADGFSYRAQVLQRQVLWRQRKWGSALGLLALERISGYGYKPLRAGLTYAFVIAAFMGLYLLNAQFASPHLTWDESLVLSISSFHGRGFSSSDIHLGDNLARIAAAEAIIGLLIEITFIATFTQRFFSR